MITITYTGAVFIFCLFIIVQSIALAWVYFRIRAMLANIKEQAMIDARSIAALVKGANNFRSNDAI